MIKRYLSIKIGFILSIALKVAIFIRFTPIFQIILTYNSDFLGHRRIRHVQQFFHEKKAVFQKNCELRNYLRPSVDNIFQIILIFNGDFFG